MGASEDISKFLKHPVGKVIWTACTRCADISNFLATVNSVTLTGCSPSVGTRVQYFRASLIFPAKTDSSQTRSAWMKAVRSRLLCLSVSQQFDLLPQMKGAFGLEGLLLWSRSKPCSSTYTCDSLCP